MSDNGTWPTYSELMDHGGPFIRLTLATDQPIELSEFVGAFTALAAEYDRYVRGAVPELGPEATLYVREVRAGSIIADLVPYFLWSSAGLVAVVAGANTIGEFVERYGGQISTYLKPGGRLENPPKAELTHIADQLAAVARTPGSSLEMTAIEIEDGQQKIRAVFKFNTAEAREIERRVMEHKKEIEGATGEPYERALMIFTRSDVRAASLGKRTGELVRIQSISDRSVPLVYASELAEREIKHEIAEAEDNVYKKGFVVDVFVEERRDGKPIAYRVTNLHQVIDLPDE